MAYRLDACWSLWAGRLKGYVYEGGDGFALFGVWCDL